ncbi:hypothetical protein PHYPSEUDO_004144 [Phytophthora pseudosyringae]|uniref:Uncharacterized protein n=1 Tax=Phytophthora pseudosyringae TaxID=221518 RepID=A0A8T1WC42_9STRA|nr:hypothetical protein PHYPSEUDO_004144 [Phytophthora pseudosyringae]
MSCFIPSVAQRLTRDRAEKAAGLGSWWHLRNYLTRSLTREGNLLSMDEVSSETAQELTLDTTHAPPASSAQEMVEPSSSPPSPELMLRLDDLSQDGTRDDQVGTIDDEDEQKSNDEGEPPLQRQISERRGLVDRDAKRMETRLQRNLKQQQAHYARQRRLFENLRAESSPSSINSNSPRSSDDQEPLVRQRASSPRKLANAVKAKFRFQKEELTKIGSHSRQRTRSTREDHTHRPPSVPKSDANDDGDDSHVQIMLRRIKEKARAEFHRQRLSTGGSSATEIAAAVRSKAPAEFFEEMQQHEASNDALRRQLELLRRLQLENNRFRQESRSLRERNEALKERDEIRDREVKRLRDEVCELEAKVQRDQMSLATAAQTQLKLKATQKRSTAAQAEIRDLQAALQEARDARDQLQSESQLEISDLVLEVKRWKRNAKQLRQQKNRSGEEIEFCKKTIAALEEEVAERRSKLKDAKREIAQLAAMIEEKTAQCESVETSAADCVKRMEEAMEALQKTHTHEREKRKKMENVRTNLQMQMERMQAENALLLDKHRELEQQLVMFQEHWKERKQAYQDQLQRLAAQLEEHVSKHKSDAATIGSLRDECEGLENRLGEAEAAAIDLKTAVAEEARSAQKQVEVLRKYVERALHDSSDDGVAALEDQVDPGRSRRDEEVPELQVVQAAISALRNEIMNIVHEFQRARHLVRQHGSKLTLVVERATELEHLRAEDAAKMKELREQRKLAEQAREIVSKEKMEVLKWSEQQCEKSEELGEELKRCGQLVLRLRKELHRALETEESWGEPESASAEPLTRSFSALEKEVDALVSMRDRWRTENAKQSHDVKEAQSQVQSLEKELAVKIKEFKQTLEEVERVHSENAEEQKLHFEQCVADVDSERVTLESKLEQESAKIAEEKENNAKLQQVVDGFEEDLPVFATILHLFVLVVQPLILQVSDLLAQKRYLSRENAEFAQAHEQIDCIGQVLKEMIPAAAPNQEKLKERQRRRVFRRVVIAVFAMNRFQHFATNVTDTDDQSAYGLSAPLKVVKSRKRASALTSQPTVIKLLPPQQTLSRLSLRPLLERLKKMEITEKVAEVMESNSALSGHMPSSLGNLILKVVMAINPASKDFLVANTNGTFHCEALLERRRRSSKKRADQHDDVMAEYEKASALEDDIPTVALIRKRILALGKRVEDLHYQRNSLQKENYEFQFQLDQQANSLKDMDVLLKKSEDLQNELAASRSQSDQELQKAQQEHQAKDQAMQSKEGKLVEAQAKIETLHAEVSDTERRIETIESEKASLRRELDQLKSSSIEEEEKAGKSKATARRQEEEVRSLKQAVKKAHELYQKVSWQLEQEVQEKSTLQAVVNHLRHQQEKTERELREEKLRELEKSFNEDNESDEDDVEESYAKARMLRKSCETKICDAKSASLTMKGRRKTTFAPTIDTHSGRNKRDEALTCTSRRHKCENSKPDQSECASPSSSAVSPLPPRVHSTKSCCSEEVDNFLSEWQQLSVSKALSDAPPPPGREVGFQSDATDSSKPSPAKSPASPENGSWDTTPTEKSRRRIEINKVNAAVHDYMDRMDDKLSKMYGIPPSSAIPRSTGRRDAKPLKTRRCSRGELHDDCMDWGTRPSSLKVDEVRVQQYHSDVGSYDD